MYICGQCLGNTLENSEECLRCKGAGVIYAGQCLEEAFDEDE